jgi:Cyclic nucleotide-binding domain
LRVGRRDVRLAAVAMPTRRRTERLGTDAVRFVQTAGARTGAPWPRRVNRAPFVQLEAPLAWTTLSLTLRADGTQDFQLGGASPFPRHWLYNGDHRLVAKSAVIDYKRWTTDIFGGRTPWGGADSPVCVAEAESSLERELSVQIMLPEARQRIRRLHAGARLTEQGESADQVFLLLDGVLRVDVDGKALADIGPGAVLGERAGLEAGHRTASLTPVTSCTVAVVRSGFVNTLALEQLAQTHRREDQTC